MDVLDVLLEVEEVIRGEVTAGLALVPALVEVDGLDVDLEGALSTAGVLAALHNTCPGLDIHVDALHVPQSVRQNPERLETVGEQTHKRSCLLMHKPSVLVEAPLGLERCPTPNYPAHKQSRTAVHSRHVVLEIGDQGEGGLALGMGTGVGLLAPMHTKHVLLEDAAGDGGVPTGRVGTDPSSRLVVYQSHMLREVRLPTEGLGAALSIAHERTCSTVNTTVTKGSLLRFELLPTHVTHIQTTNNTPVLHQTVSTQHVKPTTTHTTLPSVVMVR